MLKNGPTQTNECLLLKKLVIIGIAIEQNLQLRDLMMTYVIERSKHVVQLTSKK
jgi:hypothetical protein